MFETCFKLAEGLFSNNLFLDIASKDSVKSGRPLLDFRHSPRCQWDPRSSEILRSLNSYLPTFRDNLTIPYPVRWTDWLLVGDQLDAKFLYIIRLFQSSTCFEQTRTHHQEVNCINTASGIVTLCNWPSGMQVEQELLELHTGRPLTESDYIRCCINTIDLMMSTCLLETSRGLK
jgi:hypothetical protein